MSSFSIDLASERIVDSRSRSYFEEVSRTFATACYRSSLVMLWTVVVCDLVYKLQTLRDMHGDTSAGALLKEIEAKQLGNPNSPDWEVFLLDEVFKRTKMLESGEYVQLQGLQKLRHLSAHPVLSGTDLLFHPTKETARAQIRSALEAVLLKPPLFSKRIIGALADDIAANKSVLISPDKIRTYLEARYFPNMPVATELELFRAFWKFCFKLKNADTDANRDINAAAIAVIYSRRSAEIRAAIDADQAFFSDVGPEPDLLTAVVDFLAQHPELYAHLNAAAEILVTGHVGSSTDMRVRASFLHVNFADHLAALKAESADLLAKMGDGAWQALLRDAETEGLLQEALEIAIRIYGGSGSYDGADARFARFVAPDLDRLDRPRIEALLQAIESNSQTHGRGRATLDHRKVKAAADALAVDTTPFKSFTSSL